MKKEGDKNTLFLLSVEYTFLSLTCGRVHRFFNVPLVDGRTAFLELNLSLSKICLIIQDLIECVNKIKLL